jgi:hypothetical protein
MSAKVLPFPTARAVEVREARQAQRLGARLGLPLTLDEAVDVVRQSRALPMTDRERALAKEVARSCGIGLRNEH